MEKYFAFGSNISRQQMIKRVGYVPPGTPHTMNDWKITFNCGWDGVLHTYANIQYHIGAKLEGIIYNLTYRQLKILDYYEALYKRVYFKLNDEMVWIYISKQYNIQENKKPTLDYLNTIIDACQEINLLDTYNYLLQYKKDNYILKRGNKHGKKRIIKS